MNNSSETRSQITFYLLFALTGLLVFWLVHAYLGVIAFSFVTVIALKPLLYNRFWYLCKGWEKLAMTLTLLIGLALPLLVVWIVGRMVVAQAYQFVNNLQQTNTIEHLADSFTPYLQALFASDAPFTLELLAQLRQALIVVISWLAGALVNLGMSIPDLLVDLFVYLVLVGALLPT